MVGMNGRKIVFMFVREARFDSRFDSGTKHKGQGAAVLDGQMGILDIIKFKHAADGLADGAPVHGLDFALLFDLYASGFSDVQADPAVRRGVFSAG
jgi:hypothetical protein